MRVTANSLLNNYQKHLGTTAEQLDRARERSKNFRKYSKVEENPGSYALESKVIRKLNKNDDFIQSANQAESRLQNQDKALQSILDISRNVSKRYSLEALNGTSAAQRKIYASQLENMQESMVQLLNTNENGDFLFAGADGKNPPFELDGGRLYYRGRDVESGDLREGLKAADHKKGLDDLHNEKLYYDLGFGLKMDPSTTVAPGAAGTNGKFDVKPSSAFDIALPGLKAIGWADKYDKFYSQDTVTNKAAVEVNVDKTENIITLAGKMAKMLREYDSGNTYVENMTDESGRLMVRDKTDKTKLSIAQDADGNTIYEKNIAVNRFGELINRSTGALIIKEKATPPATADVPWTVNDLAKKESNWDTSFSQLLKKFDAAYDRVLATETQVGVKMNFVDMTKQRLDLSNDILTNQYEDLVKVKPEQAFMDYSYALNLYNTALRIGTSIIPKSLAELLPM